MVHSDENNDRNASDESHDIYIYIHIYCTISHIRKIYNVYVGCIIDVFHVRNHNDSNEVYPHFVETPSRHSDVQRFNTPKTTCRFQASKPHVGYSADIPW